MAINVVTKLSSPGAHNIDLQVDVVGLQIIVRAGSIRHAKIDYQLQEDEEFTCVPTSKVQTLDGCLYRDMSLGELHVMVEAREEDDLDAYDWGDTAAKLLYGIFEAVVPANASSLDEADITVYRTVPPPPPSPDAGGEG